MLRERGLSTQKTLPEFLPSSEIFMACFLRLKTTLFPLRTTKQLWRLHQSCCQLLISPEDTTSRSAPEEELRLEAFAFIEHCDRYPEWDRKLLVRTERANGNYIDIATAAMLIDAAIELIHQQKEKLLERAQAVESSLDMDLGNDPDDLFCLPKIDFTDVAAVRWKNEDFVFALRKVELKYQEVSRRRPVLGIVHDGHWR
jgi:hypothetical protein